MSSAPNSDGDDDILRVIQAKIDRENAPAQTLHGVSPLGSRAHLLAVGDENESPRDSDPSTAGVDWEATTIRASRETAAWIRDAETFRERLDTAREAVDAMAKNSVSLREIESLSRDFGARNEAHKRELEEVARLNGITLEEDTENERSARQ
jgi:CRP-like cAMP-binding protein